MDDARARSGSGPPRIGNLLAAATYATAGLLCVPAAFQVEGLARIRALLLCWCLCYAGALAVGIWRLRPGRSRRLYLVLSNLSLVQAWIYLIFWSRVVFRDGDPGGVLAVGAFLAGPALALVGAAYARRAIWFTMAQAGGPASAILFGMVLG